tara:strand:+ start:1950 stop:2471 length:522 start_codon:yes stop_codon:yes gene_type:complete
MSKKTKQDSSALLPAELKGASDEKIDEYVQSKIDDFEFAVDNSTSASDPLRRFIAKECIRLAVDPRINQGDVRARSSAFLNSAKILGLDRNTPQFDITVTSVETALKRLRESATEGVNAAGRVLSVRTRGSLEEVSAGSQVLLRESPECDQRTVSVGPIRTTLSDSGEGSGPG